MKKRISDLLDGYEDSGVELSGDTPLSSARIKELTMSKITPSKKKLIRWPVRLLAAAAIAAALTASAFAVVRIAGAGELMRDIFTAGESGAPLTTGQIGALDRVGKTFGEGVTDNGATLTPIAAVADANCFYLRLRIEAPEGAVLPDLDPDAGGAYQLWGSRWPEEMLTFTSETGDLIGGYNAYTEVLPDNDPTDNVKEVVVRYTTSYWGNNAVFNNGSAKLLTVRGLWIQSPDKGYTPVFTGEFVLDVGGCFDERVLAADCGGADYHDGTGYGYTTWLDRVELSPLSMTASYRNNVNGGIELREGVMSVAPGLQGLRIVLKDDTAALDNTPQGNADVPDGWDPAVMLTGGPGETIETHVLFDQPLDLDQVDYIQFGEHIIPVDPQ